jgi:hypothetical protein
MLRKLKLMLRGTAPDRDLATLEQWAQQHNARVRRLRDPAGLVAELSIGLQTWRIEWGTTQRPYIQGAELRLGADLGLPKDLQVLLLDKPLADALEKSVFDEIVQGVQTRIDTDTPQEMRWLVMLPRLDGTQMRELRSHWVGLASAPPWLAQWLAGPLGAALAGLPPLLPAGQPLLWQLNKGRLSLRTRGEGLGANALEALATTFECALREAVRVAAELREVGPGQSTMPAAWPRTGLGDMPPR